MSQKTGNQYPVVSVFANFRINDEERLQRLKDSFQSFKDIKCNNWFINVRGKYQFDALFYLHENLGKNSNHQF